MELTIQLAFAIISKDPNDKIVQQALEECRRALLALEYPGCNFLIAEGGTEVLVSTTIQGDFEAKWESFLTAFSLLTPTLTGLRQITATLWPARLAHNALTNRDPSAFYSGTFKVTSDYPFFDDPQVGSIKGKATPSAETIVVDLVLNPATFVKESIWAFSAALKKVLYNAKLTNAARALIMAERSGNRKRIAERGKALYHLIAEGLPKPE